jgi:hypothetical protein
MTLCLIDRETMPMLGIGFRVQKGLHEQQSHHLVAISHEVPLHV